MALAAVPLTSTDSYGFARDEYFTSLMAADRSEETLQAYQFGLNWLLKATGSTDRTPVDIVLTPSGIEKTMLAMRQAGLQPSSQASAYRALRAFGRWCVRRRILAHDPTESLTAPSGTARPKPVLGEDDINQLMKACTGRGANNLRDAALIAVLAGCGLRRGELSRLDLDDWDRVQHTLYVRTGKTRHARRMVYVPASVEAHLYRWLRERERFLTRNGLADPQALFVTLKRGSGQRLEGPGVRAVITRRAASIGASIHPHLLRHSFAHQALAAGLPDLVVATALGHADVSLLASTYGATGRQARAVDAFAALDGRGRNRKVVATR